MAIIITHIGSKYIALDDQLPIWTVNGQVNVQNGQRWVYFRSQDFPGSWDKIVLYSSGDPVNGNTGQLITGDNYQGIFSKYLGYKFLKPDAWTDPLYNFPNPGYCHKGAWVFDGIAFDRAVCAPYVPYGNEDYWVYYGIDVPYTGAGSVAGTYHPDGTQCTKYGFPLWYAALKGDSIQRFLPPNINPYAGTPDDPITKPWTKFIPRLGQPDYPGLNNLPVFTVPPESFSPRLGVQQLNFGDDLNPILSDFQRRTIELTFKAYAFEALRFYMQRGGKREEFYCPSWQIDFPIRSVEANQSVINGVQVPEFSPPTAAYFYNTKTGDVHYSNCTVVGSTLTLENPLPWSGPVMAGWLWRVRFNSDGSFNPILGPRTGTLTLSVIQIMPRIYPL